MTTIHRITVTEHFGDKENNFIVFKDDYLPTKEAVNNLLTFWFKKPLSDVEWRRLVSGGIANYSTETRFMEIYYQQIEEKL